MCKLRKAIYGLKQSPSVWFDKFSTIILQYSFKKTPSNHSLFVCKQRTGVIYLVVYVDDIISRNDHNKIVE